MIDTHGGCLWQRGDVVTYTGTDLGVTFVTVPTRVVEDTQGQTILYLGEGTIYRDRQRTEGEPLPRVVTEIDFESFPTALVERRFVGRSMLFVIPHQRFYDVRMSWELPHWRFRGWYVNLQEPVQRTSLGLITTDRFLDIVVHPDRTWTWKDENELQEAVGAGRLTGESASLLRAEGHRVVADIEACRFPFDDTLLDWRPDPGWNVPGLPMGWADHP